MAPRPRFRLLPRRRQRLQLEPLEDRTTPSADITASGQKFTVTDDANENITLTVGLTGGNYVLDIVGSTFTTSESNVTLNSTKDQATIPANKVDSWKFLLGDLDDSLVVGTGTLDSFAPVTVDGGGGNDSLTLDDSADLSTNNYSISATNVSRNGGVSVDFSAMVQVSLTGGTGDDTINVTETGAGTPVTVSGGSGNDTITVGSAGNSLDDIKGAVTVNGDAQSVAGADRLNIDDQGDTDDNTYKITATTIDRTGAGLITYATMEKVVLNATDTATKTDTITVESTASASPLTVNANDGNDTVTVGASASPVTVNGGVGNDTVSVGNGSLDGLLGTVSVSGGTGADVLKIDDSADGDGNTYSVGVLQITRTGAGDISYSSVGTVSLTAGSGADTITVKATTGLTVNVDAGAGGDSVTVGNGSLDNMTGTLTLTAGASVGDTDTLTMDDSADMTNNTYTVSATTAARTTGTDVSFDYTSSGFEQLVLLAGKGDDTVTAPTLDDLVAGVSLDGGVGSDQLFVDDSAQTNGHTYSVSASSIQRTDGTLVGLSYSSFDDVTLSAGSGDDTISVTSTAANSTLTVNAKSGGDTISLAASAAGSTVTLNAGVGSDGITVGGGSLDNLKGSLTLSAGMGDTDTLTIDDSADTTGHKFTVSNSTVTTEMAGDFDYDSSGFEKLVLTAGTGTDTIKVSSTKSGIPVTVSGGDGNDAITIDGLDDIIGPVTVNGDDGATDSLTVDDSADSGSDTYEVTATEITRGSVTIDYGTTENVTLDTGKGDDTVNVTATAAGTLTVDSGDGKDTVNVIATAAGTTLTVDTGKGDDTVALGSGSLLTDVAGTVSVNAGSGNDQLNLFDQDFATATTYKVDSGQITRTDGPVMVAYTGQMEQVSLKTGTKANTINILGTPNGSNLTVTGGADDDTVTAGSGTLDNLLGDVTVHAGGATNTLNVDDSTDISDNDYTITSTEVTRTDAATLKYDEFSTFTLAAGTGKNTITVTSTSTANTTVTGGTSEDTFEITGAGLANNSTNTFVGGDEASGGDTFTVIPVPDTIGANISIVGGKGDDTLFIKLDKSQSTPTFKSGKVTFATGFMPIDYSDIESTGLDTPQVILTSAGTDDTLTITATGVNDGTYTLGAVTNKFKNVESFTWDAGDGNDILVIDNPTNGLFAPASGITFISGGQAGDALRVFGGKATSGTFEVGPTPGDVRITHTSATDTMTINATGLPTTVNAIAVQDSVTEALFTTYATDAADTITVTDKAAGLTRVALSAGTGVPVELLNKTRLEVHGGDAFTGGGAADIINVNLSEPVGGADNVDVIGDDGADTVAIESVALSRKYSVDGGGGDDIVTIGQAGLLDFIQGAGTVAGGNGADVLNIDDKAHASSIVYTITATSVDRAGAGIITYGTVESLTVDTAQGADSILVDSTPAATAVRVNAGAGDDTVTVNGTSGSLALDGGDGNDTFTVVGIAGPLVLDGGNGNDTFAIGTGSLDTLVGAVSVQGGVGSDALSVNDSKDTSDNTYAVGLTQVARTAGGSVAVDYDAVEQLALAAGDGADAIGITATSTTMSVSVSAGAGDDAVTVGGGTLDNLLGTLVLDAGGGSDRLIVDDSSDTNDNIYSVTNADVARKDGAVVFAYPAQGFEELVLSAGTGNDTVTITGTATAIPVTVQGGGGDDTVIVGDGSLDSLLAEVSVDGGAGADRLAVDDSKATTNNVYTLDFASISRTDGAVAVDYSTFEQLALAAGAGNDAISVPGIAAGVVASIDGGTGDDVVTAGDGSLDNLLGSLIPDGGAGSANRLIVDDSTDSDNNNYDISTTTVTRSGTPVVIPYTSNFQSVLVRAGEGNDAISVASSATIQVSVDGGDGNDSFSLGFLSGSIAGGDGNDTIVGDNVGRTYTLTGVDAGSVSGILAAGFTTVENLTGGTADDIFTFNNGGSLSGAVSGGLGQDTLNGDNADRTFTLIGANAGSVGGLVDSFNTLEDLNGGAGNDTLVVENGVPVNGLDRFDGGIGFDTANLSDRSEAQQIAIFARGPLDGFNVTGGSAGVAGSSIVTRGFIDIDRVFGSATSKADILAGLGAANATWQVTPQDGVEDSYAATGRSLAFDQFEQLVGQTGDDDFRVDFSVDDHATSRLLLRGGGGTGTDVVRMIGGTDVKRNDTLTVLPKARNWPSDSSPSPLFAGLQFNSGQPVLYDDTVETLDLQGGDGDDTFLVDPGPKPPKGTPAIPLYGNAVRTLLLQGQLGADTFAVVPDKFKLNGSDPPVTIHVFGGSGVPGNPPSTQGIGTPAKTDEHDQMTLYRLPLKFKANFPVNGQGGLRTNKFDLRWLRFARVYFYNMWTVKADIRAPQTD